MRVEIGRVAWFVELEIFQRLHGRSGGVVNANTGIVEESLDGIGAEIMGRGKFGPPEGGPWGDEPWEGWWGDEPPFHKPVFVLTHHAREPLMPGDTTFTFVTDGIESALDQARRAAGGKDVYIGGGADTINQFLFAGLLDEIELHPDGVAGALLSAIAASGLPLLRFERIEPSLHQIFVDRVGAALGSAPDAESARE